MTTKTAATPTPIKVPVSITGDQASSLIHRCIWVWRCYRRLNRRRCRRTNFFCHRSRDWRFSWFFSSKWFILFRLCGKFCRSKSRGGWCRLRSVGDAEGTSASAVCEDTSKQQPQLNLFSGLLKGVGLYTFLKTGHNLVLTVFAKVGSSKFEVSEASLFPKIRNGRNSSILTQPWSSVSRSSVSVGFSLYVHWSTHSSG